MLGLCASAVPTFVFLLHKGKDVIPLAPVILAAYIGAVAFLAPWRKKELTVEGWVLVLAGFSGSHVVWMCAFAFAHYAAAGIAIAAVTLACFTLGLAATLLRARYADACFAIAAAGVLYVSGTFPSRSLVSSLVDVAAAGALTLAAWLLWMRRSPLKHEQYYVPPST